MPDHPSHFPDYIHRVDPFLREFEQDEFVRHYAGIDQEKKKRQWKGLRNNIQAQVAVVFVVFAVLVATTRTPIFLTIAYVVTIFFIVFRQRFGNPKWGKAWDASSVGSEKLFELWTCGLRGTDILKALHTKSRMRIRSGLARYILLVFTSVNMAIALISVPFTGLAGIALAISMVVTMELVWRFHLYTTLHIAWLTGLKEIAHWSQKVGFVRYGTWSRYRSRYTEAAAKVGILLMIYITFGGLMGLLFGYSYFIISLVRLVTEAIEARDVLFVWSSDPRTDMLFGAIATTIAAPILGLLALVLAKSHHRRITEDIKRAFLHADNLMDLYIRKIWLEDPDA